MKKVSNYFHWRKMGLLIGLLAILSFAGKAQNNFYVSPSGNDANNGSSAATAMLTIQHAINTAAAGDIINLEAGTYNARVTITKSLTLQGSAEAACILSGTGLVGNGKGILISNGVTNVTIRQLTVQNFAGSNGNTDAGIYAPGGNNNLKIEQVTIKNNVGGSGFYANGPINNVTLDYVTSSGHTVNARGIVIWNGLKSNITITNCQVFGNNCCGIELQDGSASGVTMSNNNVYNNGDNGMSAVGLTGSVGPNVIANNVLKDNGRFGIEVKNPNGGTTVSGNSVSRTIPFVTPSLPAITGEVRDGAGISIYRRGVLGTNVDIPTGVKVVNNTVSGYVQPSASEGFGIIVEGTNHLVTGNTVSGCEVGIQQQAGYLPYPGDGDQLNKVDAYFGRGNAPIACGNLISANTFSSNGIDTRNTGTIGGTGFITNTTTGETFCSIQAAINDAQTLAGHTLELTAGIFNEQVLVNKSVIIKGVGASQPVINFTGTPTGKPTVFDISVANVTIENLYIKVDFTRMRSGIIASGTNVSNLTIKNNKIEAYGSSNTLISGFYGDMNAVSVNYSGKTNYRIASGGVSNIIFSGNTILGVIDDGFGNSRFFRSGISADETGGTFSGNTIQSINHDILVRFGNNGHINITNNIFNGGGAELTDMNAGAGILTVSGNSFNAAFANIAAPNTAVLRLKNNYHAKTTLVNTNTFSNHKWAVSIENYNAVILDNNSFTPLSGDVSYRHITINTKSISTNSFSIAQVLMGAVITKNNFFGSGVTGGSALSFYNHDADAASFGNFVVGGVGNENVFNAGLANFISLDNQTGASNTSVFPAYSSVIGVSAPAITTMTAWAKPILAENNRFDAGSGLQLPSAMNLTSLFSLEDKVQHKMDAAALGFVTVKANNDYVTVNSFLAPAISASIQRGVDAASNGFTVNVGQGTFTDNIIVNKEVEIRGQGQSLTKIIPALSNPNCGGSGGSSICAGSSNVFLVQANNVTINQLAIDGDNPLLTSGNVIDGADIDARNGIITNHVAGIYSNLNVNHVTMQNIFLRGIYASSGGSFSFSDNTVSNVKGNPGSIALFNFGCAGSFTNNTVSNANDGIASNWSLGTVYIGNTITNSGSGIHTDNNGGRGGVADLILNNQVSNSSVNGYGIWVFAPYKTVLVKNNTISNVDVGLAAAGQQLPVTPVFTGNTVDGQNKPNSTGVYITTNLFGFGSSNVSVSLENNYVRNNTDGLYLESEAGNNLTLEAHNNSLTGNSNSNVTQGVGTSGAGSFNANMECNWWGTASAAGITASVNGAAVDHSPWLSNGTDNDLVSFGFQPGGICSIAVSNAQVIATNHVQCAGSSTGSATISFDNGFAAFTFTIDGGAPVSIAGSPFTINGLAAGTHAVIIRDGGGNSSSLNLTITEPAPITVNYNASPILCNGGLSTESITINGGTAPYTVVNQGGGALVNGAASGITYYGSTYAANYTYTVTDANGCQYSFAATIPQPSVIHISSSATPIICNGFSTITVNASGGTAPYSGTGTFTVIAGTYTYTVTDANGCSATTVITPSVIPDNTAPVITAVANQSFCVNPGGNYTIPLLSATDNCSIASVSYTITGATERTGSGYNASGSFNTNISTITWTVTDVAGNSSTSTTTVTINSIPVAIIAVSNADAFCNKLTLTANHVGAGISTTYNWLSGSSSFANTQQISLGQAQGDGLYSVSVTVNGCTSNPVSYHFQKQNLISSYTILAFDEVKFGENNTVASGSVGVTSLKGKASFKKNSSVSSPGSFVKARYINKDGSNINITNPVYSAATGIALPTMLYNTTNTNNLPNASINQNTTTTLSGNYKNLTLKKGSTTTLTGHTFGSIKVEKGAKVTFMATTINIDNLSVEKGPKNGYSYIRFAANANVLVRNTVSIGSQVWVNPDNYKITFYMGDNRHDDERFSVKGGDTKIIANIFLPNGKLKVTGGYAYGNGDNDDDDNNQYGNGNSYVYMTGLFIAQEIEGNGKNVIWNNFDCSAGPVTFTAASSSVMQGVSPETNTSTEELKVTVLPNPSSNYFTLKITSKYETPVNMRVMDANGRIVDARSKIGANSTIQIGKQYSSGIYYAEMIQGTSRKVVQLVKVRG